MPLDLVPLDFSAWLAGWSRWAPCNEAAVPEKPGVYEFGLLPRSLVFGGPVDVQYIGRARTVSLRQRHRLHVTGRGSPGVFQLAQAHPLRLVYRF